MFSYWDLPELPEEKELIEKHKVKFETVDKYCLMIKLESGLIIKVCAFPEYLGISTSIDMEDRL